MQKMQNKIKRKEKKLKDLDEVFLVFFEKEKEK